MQYCPHCERPVRTLQGDCPHCAKPLGASSAPAPGTTPSAPPPAAQPVGPGRVAPAPPPASSSGAGESDLDELRAEGGPLDLAFDPRESAASSPSNISVPPVSVESVPPGGRPRRGAPAPVADAGDLPPEEVERVAGVTRPKNALLAPMYAWRALRRLPALRIESAARVQEAEHTEAQRREAFAAWGRDHGRELAGEAPMKPFIDKAVQAHHALQGFLSTHETDFEKLRKLDGAVDQEAKSAEGEKAKLAGVLTTKEAHAREKGETLGRARAKLRRIEIELRNLERMAEGKLGEGSPHQARAVELQQARAAAAGEVSQAEGEERQARDEAQGVRAERAAIDQRVEAHRQAAHDDPSRHRLEEDQEHQKRGLEDALAAVAAQALARKLLPADSPDARRLRSLEAAVESARRTKRLHEAALESIDRKTIAIGIAIPAGLLVLLIVLLALLR